MLRRALLLLGAVGVACAYTCNPSPGINRCDFRRGPPNQTPEVFTKSICTDHLRLDGHNCVVPILFSHDGRALAHDSGLTVTCSARRLRCGTKSYSPGELRRALSWRSRAAIGVRTIAMTWRGLAQPSCNPN